MKIIQAKKKIIRVVTVDISFGLLQNQLKFLNEYFQIIGVSSDGPIVEHTRETEGVEIYCIPMHRRISLLQDIKSLILLYSFFKKQKPDLVHSMTPKAGLLSMVASFFAKVPHRWHTFTGLIFPYRGGVFQKILILSDKILCKCATKIFPEGNGVKKDLQKFGITNKPLSIIANGNINGIDLDFFNPDHYKLKKKNELKEQLGILDTDFTFIFVGRLVGDKGITELVKAFKKLNDKHANVKLLLVGTYEEELDPLPEEIIQSINATPNIITVGWQTDVRSYFSISDALAFPSYREGFPNVVLQAGAMRLPSIVSDISGCNEIVKENVNGIIIPSKDEIALFNAMEKFIEQPELVITLAKNARPMILKKYDRKLVHEALLNEYRKVLE